jgi:RNA polymerase sigma factor (sigma-70 family)
VVADRSAFEAFYRERLPRVVRACVLVTLDRDAAEEIAAEAFARLWSSWDRIEDEDHAGGYVYTTAMRLCTKRWTRWKREVVAEVSDRPTTDELGRIALREAIFAALAELPLRQRQCVVLRDWAGFETVEVARMLRMRASTVRVHLSRGRASLRRALAVEELDG